MAAVKDDVELLPSLHLLQQRFGVLRLQGQLPDLQADVVPGRRLNQLLQPNQTCKKEPQGSVTDSWLSPQNQETLSASRGSLVVLHMQLLCPPSRHGSTFDH